jgi:hypothetical protein
VQLQEELRGSISHRTLSRRISALIVVDRIHRRGDSRSVRFPHAPTRTAAGDQPIERTGRMSSDRAAAVAHLAKASGTDG